MARPKGRKRTAAQAASTDSSKPDAAAGGLTEPEVVAKEPAARGRGRRPKALPKPKAEEEYFPEKRNLVSRLRDALPGYVVRVVRFWYPSSSVCRLVLIWLARGLLDSRSAVLSRRDLH